jgi:hypothetical protein
MVWFAADREARRKAETSKGEGFEKAESEGGMKNSARAHSASTNHHTVIDFQNDAMALISPPPAPRPHAV